MSADKNFTDVEYAEMAHQANREGKILVIEDGRPALRERPEPCLEEARLSALESLAARRKAVEYGGFVFQGALWDSGEKTEMRLASILRLFEAGELTEYAGWEMPDGSYLTLQPETARAAAGALSRHYARAFAVARQKRDAIEAAPSPAAVQAWLETELERGWS